MNTLDIFKPDAIEKKKEKNILRPITWDDYIGNEDLKKQLKICIDAAKERKDPLHHVLLSGQSGGGKTTVANIIANDMKTACQIVSATTIKSTKDVMSIVSKIEPLGVLFIDEIHALRRDVEEHLYSAMEDWKIDIKTKTKDAVEITTIDLPKFTLIGATTKAGNISVPMRNRFQLHLTIRPYTIDELSKIILNSSSRLRVRFESDALAKSVASISRVTPRIANNLLLVMRDFAQINNRNIINKNTITSVMALLGIYENGLTDIDLKYMTILNRYDERTPLGIKALAATMIHEDERTIEDTIEPFLLHLGYISRTKRGRCLTPEGRSFIIGLDKEKKCQPKM